MTNTKIALILHPKLGNNHKIQNWGEKKNTFGGIDLESFKVTEMYIKKCNVFFNENFVNLMVLKRFVKFF